jgi:hypothetical protein
MGTRTQRLAVHRHIGATAFRVGGFNLGLCIFGDILGMEARTRQRGELGLTGTAVKFRALHDRYEPRGRRLLILRLLSVPQVLIPDITFASDPGFADSVRPARATAGLAT